MGRLLNNGRFSASLLKAVYVLTLSPALGLTVKNQHQQSFGSRARALNVNVTFGRFVKTH